MSIKVKHEGNATPVAFASAAGGQGKRAQQDAAQMASTMQSAANAANQQLRGASAPGATPGRSNAQLVHAQAPIVSGGGGGGGSRGGGTSGTPISQQTEYKHLGGDRTDGPPEAGAFWSENSKEWVRPYKPGEQENEAWAWRYSQKQKMDMEKLRNSYADLMADPNFSQNDKDVMGQQILGQIYGMKKMPYEIEKEDDATRREREIQDRDYELKRIDAEKKRAETIAGNLMRPYTKITTDEFGEKKETVIPQWEDVLPQLKKMFPSVYNATPSSSVQSNNSSATQTTTTDVVENQKNKWDAYRD